MSGHVPILMAALLSVAAPAAAAGYEARVVAVNSGHSLVVLVDKRRIAVRLSGIEAPTGSHRYAIGARQSLIALCGGDPVQVEPQAGTADGERPARVLCEGVDAAAEQLRRGMAVCVPENACEPAYAKAQASAQMAKRGVWAPKTAPIGEVR